MSRLTIASSPELNCQIPQDMLPAPEFRLSAVSSTAALSDLSKKSLPSCNIWVTDAVSLFDAIGGTGGSLAGTPISLTAVEPPHPVEINTHNDATSQIQQVKALLNTTKYTIKTGSQHRLLTAL
jgi:hypothetical protein